MKCEVDLDDEWMTVIIDGPAEVPARSTVIVRVRREGQQDERYWRLRETPLENRQVVSEKVCFLMCPNVIGKMIDWPGRS